MKCKLGHLVVFLLINAMAGSTQSLDSSLDSMNFWGDVMSNAQLVEHRSLAADRFESLLFASLRNSPDFSVSLDSIPWISVQQPPSDSFRLVTWQWMNDESIIQNHGIVQYKGDTSLIVLQDLKRQMARPQRRRLVAPKWIGARYYRMIPFNSSGETVYLLLGYDGFSSRETVQVIDFLTIEDHRPVFGGEYFVDTTSEVSLDRRILRYMEGADVQLTYDPEKQRIVFDHLRPIEHPNMPGGRTWIPDGTYEAYQLSDGYWRYDDKVYQRILDQPPVNRPEGRKEKDLFGRERNKQG